MSTEPCDHGNTMGYHGQVICVSCGAVVRQMTPEENATDWTQSTVVAPAVTAREAFEKWFTGSLARADYREYISARTQRAWIVWQAAWIAKP